MFRKYLARLLAFVLVLNVLLCAPLRVGAEEGEGGTETFDADPVSVVTPTEGETNVVVTETVPETTVGADPNESNSGVSVEDQTVSVEIPLDEATTQEPVEGQTPTVNENGDAIKYNTSAAEGSTGETVPVEESYDLTVEIKDADVDASGKLTDIEYDVSLDQKTTTQDTSNTPSETISNNVDQAWNAAASEAGSAQPEIKVNLSANGMNSEEITRVEHKYKDENGNEQTEYYYNANQVEEGSNKKTFTVSVVETVKEAAQTVTNTVVSLWTNFLGKFHITTDAFENQDTKKMSTTLGEAVNGAKNGSTVEMLRDYETSSTAIIASSDNVTVDLNGKTYDSSNNGIWMQTAEQNGSDQTLTITNGTFKTEWSAITTYTDDTHKNTLTLDDVNLVSNFRGLQIAGKNNTVNVNRSTITVKNDDAYGVFTFSANNEINITDSTIDVSGKESIGIFDQNSNNAYVIQNSTINCSDGYWGIYHNGSTGGADIQVIGSYIYADGATGQGIYIAGSQNLAKNTLTIKDSEIYGDTGVEVKFTNVTIDNSKLVGFAESADYTPNNSGSTTTGAALAVTDNANGITGGTITINSGYFYGHKDIDSIFLAAKLQANDPQATIQLNGGRFVQTTGLYKLTDDTHAVISLNDGSEYPYEVVATGTTPTRSGYTFQGFKDENGKAITLEQAIEKKAIAYAQWEKIVEQPPVEDTPAEVPAETVPAETAPANNAAKQELIIVEADSKGNNVDIAIQDTTAVVTVSNPDGDAAAVSEVTIPSVAELKKQGVETVSVQVEENVTLELNLADAGNTLADSVKVTRDADILVISSGEQSEIVIHMTELKAAASEPVRIQLSNRVLTIHLGGDTVYQLELADDLAPGMTLTVKLEDGILKLYDKDGNLVREVKL